MKTPTSMSVTASIAVLVAGIAVGSTAFANSSIAPMIAGDNAITFQIKGMLDADPILKHYDLDVSTTDGVVRLSGTVYWISEEDAAVKIASRLPEVRAIRDNI